MLLLLFMMNLTLKLFNFIFWIFVAAVTIVVFILLAILKLVDPKQQLSYRIANLWGYVISKFNPQWNFTIKGRSHIKGRKSYVIVSNHNSLADIICLYLLQKKFKWIAKESLFRIPFFGWSMRLLGYIPLERGNLSSIKRSMEKAQKVLEEDNCSVLIFPEGTRSSTGSMGPFKSGAFKLAIRTKKPVVPVVIKGTHEVLSKGEKSVRSKSQMRIQVLAPIATDEYGEEDYQMLSSRVRERMQQAIENL